VFVLPMNLSTNQKGAIAEAKIAAAAIELGVEVYRPVAEGGRFDMIFAFESGELMRVQCKWAPKQGETIIVRGDSCVRAPGGGYRRSVYGVSEIDAVAGYCPDLDRCYLVPAAMICERRAINLRLAPSRNNQRVRIHFAEKYELGAIAQLGERRRGTAEAVGSSPTSSIR